MGVMHLVSDGAYRMRFLGAYAIARAIVKIGRDKEK